MNNYANTISFAIGVITGGLVAYIGHILSIHRDRRKEFNQAAANFKEAFIGEIRILQKTPFQLPALQSDEETNRPIYDILVKAYPKHYTAYLLFRGYLTRPERTGFDKAWQNYCYPKGYYEGGDPLLSYLMRPMSGNKVLTDKPYILNKLETLISFAKFK